MPDLSRFQAFRKVTFLLSFIVAGLCVAAEPVQRNEVSFDVTASEQVASDLLVVRVFSQYQERVQTTAANKVNLDMRWALALAEASAGIKIQTLDYRTNPVYEGRRITAWQVRQSLRLESKDSETLTALLGTLQERLAIEHVGYEVSAALRDSVKTRLTAAVIGRFKDRANQVTQSFGRQSYELKAVHINAQGGMPPPVAFRGRAMAMKADVAEPSLEPGEQTLSVTASGSIVLSAQ